jgi:hypothetical protein
MLALVLVLSLIYFTGSELSIVLALIANHNLEIKLTINRLQPNQSNHLSKDLHRHQVTK